MWDVGTNVTLNQIVSSSQYKSQQTYAHVIHYTAVQQGATHIGDIW